MHVELSQIKRLQADETTRSRCVLTFICKPEIAETMKNLQELGGRAYFEDQERKQPRPNATPSSRVSTFIWSWTKPRGHEQLRLNIHLELNQIKTLQGEAGAMKNLQRSRRRPSLP